MRHTEVITIQKQKNQNNFMFYFSAHSIHQRERITILKAHTRSKSVVFTGREDTVILVSCPTINRETGYSNVLQ